MRLWCRGVSLAGESAARVQIPHTNKHMVMRMPKEVVDAVLAIVRTGKEAVVKKERDKWVVVENGRRLVYREK